MADRHSKKKESRKQCQLGDDWVRKGIFSHNLYISAADKDVIQGLFSIGLGLERVDGLLDLRTLEFPKLDETPGITIRRAGKDDAEQAGSVAYVMIDALSGAPYWLPIPPESIPEWEERWAGRVDKQAQGGKGWAVWMALEQDHAVGSVTFFKNTEQEYETQMLLSPQTVYLATAVTKPEVRNRGIANALIWRGLEEARSEGFDFCLVNWVSANLLAARYWPRSHHRRKSLLRSSHPLPQCPQRSLTTPHPSQSDRTPKPR